MHHQPSISARSGFTLLEVILALALAGLLLSIVALSIDTYWRATDRGRAAVENAQLARALLAKIASDLKASVIIVPDRAEAAASASSTEPFSDAGLGMNDPIGGLENEFGLSDELADELASGMVEIESQGAITGAMAPVGIQPGIYGNQFELQMDISRPLRPEERMLADSMWGEAAAMPMGATTLSYFVIDETTPAMLLPHPDLVGQKGLVRREANRAAAVWASMSLGPTSMEMIPQRLDILAPEVVGLEFSYFDGLSWYPAWDSEVMQTTPVAVEILLTLETKQAASRRPITNWLSSDTESGELEQYRLLVHLPGSASIIEIMAQEEAAALEAELSGASAP